MRTHPHIPTAFKRELSDWHMWTGRGVVIAFAALAGATVVAFTWLAEHALAQFFMFQKAFWWGPFLWMPLSAAAIVWLTLRFAPGAAGSWPLPAN